MAKKPITTQDRVYLNNNNYSLDKQHEPSCTCELFLFKNISLMLKICFLKMSPDLRILQQGLGFS